MKLPVFWNQYIGLRGLVILILFLFFSSCGNLFKKRGTGLAVTVQGHETSIAVKIF